MTNLPPAITNDQLWLQAIYEELVKLNKVLGKKPAKKKAKEIKLREVKHARK